MNNARYYSFSKNTPTYKLTKHNAGRQRDRNIINDWYRFLHDNDREVNYGFYVPKKHKRTTRRAKKSGDWWKQHERLFGGRDKLSFVRRREFFKKYE